VEIRLRSSQGWLCVPAFVWTNSELNQFKSEFGSFDRERLQKVNWIPKIRKGNLVFDTLVP